MLLPQAMVVALLLQWGLPWHATAVLALGLAQLPLMRIFVRSPKEKALLLSAFGVPLYVSGMMVSAWALHFSA
jgi:chlorophyll synthase